VGIDGEDESWDFGTGAGFYVDATEDKWSRHYRMFSYITQELPDLVLSNFPVASFIELHFMTMILVFIKDQYFLNKNNFSLFTRI
jgi:hypothetical protein